jgi:hypothetical protein
MIAAEAEEVGNFAGEAIASPLLQVGTLACVIILDLSRLSSVSLNWIMSIKENYYGASPHRGISSRSSLDLSRINSASRSRLSCSPIP